MFPNIRSAVASDEAFLREMLYQSLYVPPDCAPLDRNVVNLSEIAKYVDGWGRAGDLGFIAVDPTTNQPIGAVWMRLFTEAQKGYGYVAADVPELGMALLPEYRGRGIGSILLRQALESAGVSHRAVSLSVSFDNPARRLYERFGFEPVGTSENAVTMLKRLKRSASYQLVPATNDDEAWLEALRRAVYQELFDATFGGWDEDRHARQFRECWKQGGISIIGVDAWRVGMIQLFDRTNAIEVREIQILPNHQNLGIGSWVLRDTILRAHQQGRRVMLSVGLKNQRAYQLYERLGFRKIKCDETHNHMSCDPPI